MLVTNLSKSRIEFALSSDKRKRNRYHFLVILPGVTVEVPDELRPDVAKLERRGVVSVAQKAPVEVESGRVVYDAPKRRGRPPKARPESVESEDLADGSEPLDHGDPS